MPSLDELNRMTQENAYREFFRCCGSTRWAAEMERRRPFGSAGALFAAAGEVWAEMDPDGKAEVFAHHPKIGDLRPKSETESREQGGVNGAPALILEELERGNQEYAAKFGFIFLVCATGKSADEMLGELRRRMGNDPAAEFAIAMGEQAKITRLRLERMLSG